MKYLWFAAVAAVLAYLRWGATGIPAGRGPAEYLRSIPAR